MSPSTQFFYILLFSLGLLSVWFGVQELLKHPLGDATGLILVGVGMLLLAWVITHPLKSPAAADANSSWSRILSRLDPLVQALMGRPALYAGILLGILTTYLSTEPAWQPWPILVLWAASIILFLIGTAAPGSSFRKWILQAVEWAKKSRWELFAILALTVLAFLSCSIGLGHIPYNVHGDEGEMGLQARAVLRGELRDPFITTFLSLCIPLVFHASAGIALVWKQHRRIAAVIRSYWYAVDTGFVYLRSTTLWPYSCHPFDCATRLLPFSYPFQSYRIK